MTETGGFVVNTFPYIWERTAGEAMADLAGMGFRRFEILLTAPHLWPAEAGAEARRALAAQVAAEGCEIVSLNPGGFDNNLASPAADVRRFAQDYLLEVIRLAGELGAELIVVSPGVARPLLRPPREHLMGWLAEGVDRLLPEAERAGVRLCLENIPFTFLPRAADVMEAVDRLAGGGMGVIYDVANAVHAGEDPCEGLSTVAPRLAMIHLSDTGWTAWRHDPPGAGVVPFRAIAATRREEGLDCPVAVEFITDAPARDIPEGVAALRKAGW